MPILTVYTTSKLRMKAPFYFKFIMVVCFAPYGQHAGIVTLMIHDCHPLPAISGDS